MDINYWYLGATVITLVYVIPVLVIRAGIDRRNTSRRIQDRRVSMVMVEEDRRTPFTDRRHRSRRG